MSIPTPQLPTDNLYKFVALAGLALAIAGLVLDQQLDEALMTEVRENTNKMHEGMDAVVALMGPPELADWFVTKADTEPSPMTSRKDALIRFEQTLGGLVVKMTKLLKEGSLSPDAVKAHEDALVKLKRIIFLNRESLGSVIRAERASAFNKNLVKVGFVLMCVGFFLWFVRVQKWQDMKLRNEALASVPAKPTVATTESPPTPLPTAAVSTTKSEG